MVADIAGLGFASRRGISEIFAPLAHLLAQRLAVSFDLASGETSALLCLGECGGGFSVGMLGLDERDGCLVVLGAQLVKLLLLRRPVVNDVANRSCFRDAVLGLGHARPLWVR